MEQIVNKIKNGAKVYDVRSPMEFSGGHFNGAVNIPVQELQLRIDEFGAKEEPIVVYCATGNRSGFAAMMLNAAGYKDVVNAGGVFNMQNIADALN